MGDNELNLRMFMTSKEWRIMQVEEYPKESRSLVHSKMQVKPGWLVQLRFALESQNTGMAFGYNSFGGDLPGLDAT